MDSALETFAPVRSDPRRSYSIFPLLSRLSARPRSSSAEHVEECCGWLRQRLDELNKEQSSIVHQHQEQVRAAVLHVHASG